jgi:hypothetical protein
MPPLGPIRRQELIRALRKLGFDGPYAGGRHEYMLKGTLKLFIPQPAQRRYQHQSARQDPASSGHRSRRMDDTHDLVHLQTGQSVWYSSKYGKGTYICKTTDR